MNEIPCLGIDFLARCPVSHYRDHFLFNFEIAIASMAIVISIYVLLIERRFRVRVSLKKEERDIILKLVVLVLGLTFVGAILPFIPGEPLPLFGYPIFWEILAAVLMLYVFYISYKIILPIRVFTKKQLKQMLNVVPEATRKYHGLMDLMLKEADVFWDDFLKQAQKNRKLQTLLLRDFLNPEFIKLAVTSHYILIKTYRFVGKSSENSSINEFFRKLFIHHLIEDNAILAEDLESSYKPITQEIIREYKLANILFKSNGDLFFLRLPEYKNWPSIYNRFSILFNLYLGQKYHITEDSKDYISLIDSKVIEVFLEFFKENLRHLTEDERDEFMSQFAFHVPELRKLPDEESKALANGVYELLEQYSAGRDWQKEDRGWRDYHMLSEFKRAFVECNKVTKKTFQERLADKIAGTEDDKKIERFTYNLKGFYPMVVPIYFHMYGPELFSQKEPKEDKEMHMKILVKMKENLPILSQGITQHYMSDKKMPVDKRGKEAVKRKAERALESMFPEDVYYDKNENSITRISSDGERVITLLLNEIVEKMDFVYKDLQEELGDSIPVS